MSWLEGLLLLALLTFLIVRFFILPEKRAFEEKRRDDLPSE